MQPALVLTEEQRNERFSESLNRKRIKTEQASLVCLPTSKPIATVSPFLIVPQGSQTMEKNCNLESLVTTEHQEVKPFKSSAVPEKVSVIIRGPSTNNYDVNDTLHNENTDNDNDNEQFTENVTSELLLRLLTSLEDEQNVEIRVREENQIMKMFFPQNHHPTPPENLICETLESFFENTNGNYIDINFDELPDDIESHPTSKFKPENSEKEDTMEYEATSNDFSKHIQSGVENEDSKETKIILKYAHKKFDQKELEKQKYSASNFDSSKENLSIENR